MSRASRIVLAMLVLAVFVMLGALGLRAARDDAPSAHAEKAAPSTTSPAPVMDAGDAAPALDVGEHSIASRTSQPSDAQAAVASTGALRLAFVSALDRTPVAGLPFVVFRERGGDKELARGTSDADGRAVVGELEENVILVESERLPPFARHIAATWLTAGETKELEIALDGGGSVVGRIVDDEERPVANAEILVLGNRERESPVDTTSVGATTGRDGRFRIEHMACKPSGVWIVAGAMRPERWLPARLVARADAVVEPFFATVEPGREYDVGDIELRRSVTYRGRVLDAARRPVEGALVTQRSERLHARLRTAGNRDAFTIRPGQDGFRLHALESLTSSGGAFEIHGEGSPSATVWTADGRIQAFEFPRATPGATFDGIELVLDRAIFFDVSAADAHGRRIDRAGPAVREPGINLPWDEGGAFYRGGGHLRLRLVDGTAREATSSCDADGAFHFQFEASPQDCASLRFTVVGYEPIEATLAGNVETRTKLSFVLTEMPSITLRLRSSSKARDAKEVTLQIQGCLASAEQRHRGSPTGAECCGRGAYVPLTWKGEERALVLPAIERAPYWVYVRGMLFGDPSPWREFQDVLTFGPFEAGPEVRDLDIDLDALRAVLAEGREARDPPPPTSPEQAAARGRISILLVDAISGEAIEKGSITGKSEDVLAVRGFHCPQSTDRHGRLSAVPVPVGTWQLVASARAHRPADLGTVRIGRDEHVDLGRVALERRPALRGRIVFPDGTPLSAWLQLSCADGKSSVNGLTTDDGAFTLYSAGGDRCWLLVSEQHRPNSEDLNGVQRIAVEAWTPGDERTITIARFHTIDVRVSGTAAQLGTAILACLCPARGEQGSRCDHSMPLPDDHGPFACQLETDAEPGRRVFRFRIAAGHYVVYGGGLIADIPATEITVDDRDAPQSFDVTSR